MFEFLKYREEQPLLFTSALFWALFFVFMLVYTWVYKYHRTRSFVTTFFSWYFYYLCSGFYFILVIISSVTDYYLGLFIERTTEARKRKLYVFISVFVNLSLLAYFKYIVFFTDVLNALFDGDYEVYNYLAAFFNYWGFNADTAKIILPVGISFYTFQTISYTVDVYRRDVKAVKHFMDFAFYVSFFPQLVAGPIVRAKEFIPQIYQKFYLSYEAYSRAIYLIIGGLIKKIIFADFLAATLVNNVFEDPTRYTGAQALVGVYAYAMQIYCDFSAYSDIAIGLALLLGFTLPQNFNSPYKALNITDFWRRWHISLSSWLKDYLYIPLGGNRKGKLRTYVNLLITMLLGGLWHGQYMRYVVWGALHGVALAVHKFITSSFKSVSFDSAIWNVLGAIFTFHFVCFCWIYFKADSMGQAHAMMYQVIYEFEWQQIGVLFQLLPWEMTVLILSFALHLLPKSIKEFVFSLFKGMPDIGKAAVICLLIIVFYQFASYQQSFIYSRY